MPPVSTAAGAETALPRFVFTERPLPTAPSGPGTAPDPQARRTEIQGAQRAARFGPADMSRVPNTTITVRHDDTLEKLAELYGTTIDQLARLNPDIHNLDDLRVGQQLQVPINRQVVEVQPGDTLSALAERYGVSVDQLAAANGVADPGSIEAGQRIAIVPERTVGLDRAAEVKTYIADMRALEREWSTLTPDQRLTRMTDAVNARLAAAGVPPVRITPQAGGAGGVYNFQTHSVGVGADLLKQATVSTEEIRGLANTVYHEGRHAEQWFDMARLQIAEGQDPAAMGLPQSVVSAARAAPRLDPSSLEGRFIAAMYDSVYGAGGADRNDVLTKLNNGDYSVYELYRGLPEEADAWRVGGKVDNLWPRS